LFSAALREKEVRALTASSVSCTLSNKSLTSFLFWACCASTFRQHGHSSIAHSGSMDIPVQNIQSVCIAYSSTKYSASMDIPVKIFSQYGCNSTKY
jgi:hypothetical protein